MQRFSRFAAVALLLCAAATAVRAGSLYDAPVSTIDGQAASLAPYKGEVMLVVNVASKCGFTKQYGALETTYEKYKDRGFVVLGFPCNQFKNQEPGTNEEIKTFCTKTYGVAFPLFDKINVNGPERHPLYTELAGPASPYPGDIKWNFTKFLVGRDGKVLARFEPKTTPDSPEVAAAIEQALVLHQGSVCG